MDWLQATVLAEVPVWSGASRATFQALASSISVDIPIEPVAPDRTGLGAAMSTGNFDDGKSKPGRFVFRYSTTLPWLIINEYFDARQWGFHLTKPGPYQFQVAGQRAFIQSTRGVHLPDPWTCLKSNTIKVG